MTIFKGRDIRGKYGSELSKRDFFNVGLVLNNFSDKLVLGMDYRAHNPELCQAMLSGFGGSVSYLGNSPSPMVAYLSEKLKLGVCLTASHNPSEYHGAKFFKEKRSFFENEMNEIKKHYENLKVENYKLNREKLAIDNDLRDEYLNKIPLIEDGIYDLCGGAACSIRDIFPHAIQNKPDPFFENNSPNPNDGKLHELKKKTVSDNKLGFAFDGDADRVVIAADGKVIRGDIIIAYIAENYLKKGDSVVMSLDCSNEVYNYIKDSGLNPHYAAVGQETLIKKAQEVNAKFTGEMSHHFSFTEFMPYSDAIYFAAVFSETKPEDISEFKNKFKNIMHQEVFPFQIDFDKLEEKLSKKAIPIDKTDGIKATFEDYCVLIRASKTEPIVRASIEVEEEYMERAKKAIREEIMNVKFHL
ncbi:MAG: hypothetical protein A7316_08160 [Candidatus Altiarchaeales archaeon WOR_SM1_86-2]|nr:MAG: hypothetical protein A7316_08160 [Candidatus Altiarchaeales archaeon WOR_SM1_86-2]